MGMLQQINRWSITHHPRWLVVLRIALGLCLFIKGISFMRNGAAIEGLLAQSSFSNFSSWMILAITWVHLLGGFLIAIGLFTRLSVIIQIPILLGAVIFINQPSANGPEFFFALAILLLLIFFFFEGGGPISLDDFFSKHEA